MRWIIYVLAMVVSILLVICYALLVMVHEADEKADRMYRAWKDEQEERKEY